MRSFFNRPNLSKKRNYRRSFFILIFLLLSVIFLQKELTKPQFRRGVRALFEGDSKPTSNSILLAKKPSLRVSFQKQSLFWCSTRVVQLSVGKNIFINQDFKWFLNKVAIDSLFMERWLAQYCKLDILLKTFHPLKGKEKKPLFCVTFTTGHRQCFYKTGAFTFSWKENFFLSSQLKEGFDKILFLTNKR